MDSTDPRKDYIEALRAIVRLRTQYPILHEAVLDVIRDAQGQALVAFHREGEDAPEQAGVTYHRTAKVLNAVWATLKAPENRIRALEAPPVKAEDPTLREKVMGGVRRLVGAATGSVRK